jgi:hypothetical protein
MLEKIQETHVFARPGAPIHNQKAGCIPCLGRTRRNGFGR